jgi:hypothetical protein
MLRLFTMAKANPNYGIASIRNALGGLSRSLV